MLSKVSIQDLQFSGSDQTDQKLRRLMDDLHKVGTQFNKVIDAVNTLQSAPAETVTAHVLATTTGLGIDHTVSGLTAGQALVASSPTNALFRKLTFTDLDRTDFGTPINGDVIQFLDGYYVLGAVSVSVVAGHGITVSGSTIAVNESQLNHALLGNLLADSHPQYLLKTSYYKQFMLMGA